MRATPFFRYPHDGCDKNSNEDKKVFKHDDKRNICLWGHQFQSHSI